MSNGRNGSFFSDTRWWRKSSNIVFQQLEWILAVDVRTPSRSNSTASNRSGVMGCLMVNLFGLESALAQCSSYDASLISDAALGQSSLAMPSSISDSVGSQRISITRPSLPLRVEILRSWRLCGNLLQQTIVIFQATSQLLPSYAKATAKG